MQQYFHPLFLYSLYFVVFVVMSLLTHFPAARIIHFVSEAGGDVTGVVVLNNGGDI